VTVQCIC